MRSRHVSRVIAVPVQTAYEFAANPDHLPLWASGLATSQIVRDGDVLLVDSPMGQVRVRFTPRNSYGVLDHDVTLPSGATVNNPMRVLTHPHGTEIVFTVRQLDLTDEEFDRDVSTVEQDLERLKQLLERDGATG